MQHVEGTRSVLLGLVFAQLKHQIEKEYLMECKAKFMRAFRDSGKSSFSSYFMSYSSQPKMATKYATKSKQFQGVRIS